MVMHGGDKEWFAAGYRFERGESEQQPTAPRSIVGSDGDVTTGR
jgi:hypothetical protein